MDLDTHADLPTTVTVGKPPNTRDFLFSEITLDLGAKLQKWIKDNVPMPLKAIKDQLDGFSPSDRAILLDQARRDSLQWPPVFGSPQCFKILSESKGGLLETLRVALLKHQPDSTVADAKWIMKNISNNELLSIKILKLIFGIDEDTEDTEVISDPKG